MRHILLIIAAVHLNNRSVTEIPYPVRDGSEGVVCEGDGKRTVAVGRCGGKLRLNTADNDVVRLSAGSGASQAVHHSQRDGVLSVRRVGMRRIALTGSAAIAEVPTPRNYRGCRA